MIIIFLTNCKKINKKRGLVCEIKNDYFFVKCVPLQPQVAFLVNLNKVNKFHLTLFL